ncbi:MAG TPA: helix-turn-helix domain-containing protein [Nevskiaceae bacterium]|nr:helix-turn-helix domain-containing protein [Nevskiaceae bacterium]
MKSENTTYSCCVGIAVAILGDKWTPHIIRALNEQPMRFCQLQDAVGGINPRTLSARLSNLEEQQIITKKTLPEVPPHTEYALTTKGQDLVPILHSMAVWGEKHRPKTPDTK